MVQAIVYYDENKEILIAKSGNYKKPTGKISYIEGEIPDGTIPISINEKGEIVTKNMISDK